MPDPDAHRLDWIMGRVGADNRYVNLERADGWFVQVGYGEVAGVSAGTYALEYQEGSVEQHFRCQTTDREAAGRLLQEFLAGDEAGNGVTSGELSNQARHRRPSGSYGGLAHERPAAAPARSAA